MVTEGERPLGGERTAALRNCAPGPRVVVTSRVPSVHLSFIKMALGQDGVGSRVVLWGGEARVAPSPIGQVTRPRAPQEACLGRFRLSRRVEELQEAMTAQRTMEKGKG